MKKIILLVHGDLKLVFRDRMLSLFLFTPVILIIFVKLFIPYLTAIYPLVKVYHLYIMMFASLQTAIIFGFITSFLILEEKDEHVTEVIRVLPVSANFFILNRLVFCTFFSFLGAFSMLVLGGFAYPGVFYALLLALQYSLVAPLITLIVGTFAANKIEGMAWFKGLNLILMIPVLSFFVTGALKYLFAVVPTFWTYLLYYAATTSGKPEVVFVAGTGVYLLVLVFLFRQFRKRVFKR